MSLSTHMARRAASRTGESIRLGTGPSSTYVLIERLLATYRRAVRWMHRSGGDGCPRAFSAPIYSPEWPIAFRARLNPRPVHDSAVWIDKTGRSVRSAHTDQVPKKSTAPSERNRAFSAHPSKSRREPDPPKKMPLPGEPERGVMDRSSEGSHGGAVPVSQAKDRHEEEVDQQPPDQGHQRGDIEHAAATG